jgi:hypothetical protein
MRFYDEDIVATRPNPAFIPFGAGPHGCFGAGRWAIFRRNSCSTRPYGRTVAGVAAR